MSTTTQMESCNHVGIFQFLHGKNIFVTGATGLLGKALIEKMLRALPDVGKIFVLIRAKSEEAAMNRLKTEILESELFRCVEQIHGKFYQALVKSKLVPVAGDVCLPGLGMAPTLANFIAEEVDIIINSAANTKFDERYDVSLNANTKGPCRVLDFAKQCKKLCLFMHVSTAYVNGHRQGLILEEPFSPTLDIEAEIKLASEFQKSFPDNEVVEKMKDLGSERAHKYGWRDVYTFTKTMGEMLLNSMRGDIPVVIIRPSIIESTYSEPFPGWIQGYRMLEPLILSYGKGQLPAFFANPKTVLDVIPIDMLVNATIAAMAKHGMHAEPKLKIYHVTSGVMNPLEFQDLFRFCYKYFASSPLSGSEGTNTHGTISRMKIFGSMEDYLCYIRDAIPKQQNGLVDNAATKNIVNRNIYMAKLLEPYTFYQGLLDNRNTMKLMEEMTEEEQRKFGFDVGSIDWEHYVTNIHIPGLRRHLLKPRYATSQIAHAKL